MVTYLIDQMLSTEMYIEPKDININLNENIRDLLKKKVEEKCNDIGYILKDSVNIVKRSLGKLVYINKINNVKYNIDYTCSILQPTIGETIKCCIDSKTDAGIIGYIKLKDIDDKFKIDNDITNTPIICIIPLNRFENPEAIMSNQRINIKITAVRNKFNQSNIQVVGTPV
jgi:hypothetical protein